MMNLENLVEISSNNNQVVTDSLVVAKVFGKRHDNVIRDIKGLLKNEDTQKMFYTSTYTEKQNKQRYSEHTPTCRSGGFLIQREPPFVETEGLTLSPQA